MPLPFRAQTRELRDPFAAEWAPAAAAAAAPSRARDALACALCRKSFATPQTLATHLASRKHLERVAQDRAPRSPQSRTQAQAPQAPELSHADMLVRVNKAKDLAASNPDVAARVLVNGAKALWAAGFVRDVLETLEFIKPLASDPAVSLALARILRTFGVPALDSERILALYRDALEAIVSREAVQSAATIDLARVHPRDIESLVIEPGDLSHVQALAEIADYCAAMDARPLAAFTRMSLFRCTSQKIEHSLALMDIYDSPATMHFKYGFITRLFRGGAPECDLSSEIAVRLVDGFFERLRRGDYVQCQNLLDILASMLKSRTEPSVEIKIMNHIIDKVRVGDFFGLHEDLEDLARQATQSASAFDSHEWFNQQLRDTLCHIRFRE